MTASNLYATKLYAEHPVGLWPIDDDHKSTFIHDRSWQRGDKRFEFHGDAAKPSWSRRIGNGWRYFGDAIGP